MAINIGGVFVEYLDAGGTKHEWVQYVGTVGNSANFLADPGSTIDLSTITTSITVTNAGTLIATFLKCLEFLAPTGSTILACSADYRTDAGPSTVDASTSYGTSNFAPSAGSPSYGPYPIGFAAAEGSSSGTNKPTWLRFYSSAHDLYAQTTVFNPSAIDADLATYLSKLVSPAGNLTEYAHWSGAIDVDGAWLGSGVRIVSSMRIGCRNG